MAMNVTWRQHLTNDQLYGELPPVSSKVRQRRLHLAGHCVRHQEEIASSFVLWQPTVGTVNRVRTKITFVDTLLADTGHVDVNLLILSSLFIAESSTMVPFLGYFRAVMPQRMTRPALNSEG